MMETNITISMVASVKAFNVQMNKLIYATNKFKRAVHAYRVKCRKAKK